MNGNNSDKADQEKFSYYYAKLSKRERVKVNVKIVGVLIRYAVEHRSINEIKTAVLMFVGLVWPDVSPFILAGLLILAALIVWAWAVVTRAGGLWFACAALTCSAMLKIYTLFPAVESDEFE